MKSLIIVDWEKEWINVNSEYYIGSDLNEYTNRINRLIDISRSKNFKIIFIKHLEQTGDSFQKDSENSEFISGLSISEEDTIIKKYKISPFYKTNLDNELKNIDEIYVCGILTNLCVRSTVQDAYDRDFKVNIIEDCCVAFDEETHRFTLEDIKNTRPEVEIIKCEDFK
jgi:nicotinamidase-related amidase